MPILLEKNTFQVKLFVFKIVLFVGFPVFYRMQKEKELEGRIKEHTREMQERRRKPKGTPQEEMEAARRELEVVSVYFFHSIPKYPSRRGKIPSLRGYIFPTCPTKYL